MYEQVTAEDVFVPECDLIEERHEEAEAARSERLERWMRSMMRTLDAGAASFTRCPECGEHRVTTIFGRAELDEDEIAELKAWGYAPVEAACCPCREEV